MNLRLSRARFFFFLNKNFPPLPLSEGSKESLESLRNRGVNYFLKSL